MNFGNTVYFITQVSLRHINILGRVNASNRFLTRGAMPLGGLFGGSLGVFLSLKASLIIITFGYIFAFILLLLFPVKKINIISDAEEFVGKDLK